MTFTSQKLKPFILLIAIIIGASISSNKAHAGKQETAIVAGGCFWCVESDFESVPGVISAVSGYTGGKTANPTYKQVTRGGTGHYEAVKITYDSSKLSYAKLINLFLRSVDPTDAGGQFCDRGASYRTAIFAAGGKQKSAAQAEITKAGKALGRKIVTPVLSATTFYPAEDYHQNYYKGTGTKLSLRFGAKSQAEAYKYYRKACGRDKKVLAIWGNAAPFAGNH